MDDLFPGSVTAEPEHQHQQGKKELEDLVEYSKQFVHSHKDSPVSDDEMEEWKGMIKTVRQNLITHFDTEELDLNWIGRKHFNLQMNIEIFKNIFQLNSAQEWRKFIGLVLRNLQLPAPRVRFVKCFVWVMPERAQQIGSWIYEETANNS